MTVQLHLAERIELPLDADRFRRAFRSSVECFVLDGAGGVPGLDRFAYFGADPSATLRIARRCDPDGAFLRDASGRVRAEATIRDRLAGTEDVRLDVDPFAELRRFLRRTGPDDAIFDPRFPAPFRAGAVGYVGYECAQLLERLPGIRRPSVAMPDLAFGFYRWLLVVDRASGERWISVLGDGTTAAEARLDATRVRDEVVRSLGLADVAPASVRRSRPTGTPRPVLDRATYLARIDRAKEHIAAGDAFEICLTNPREVALAESSANSGGDAWALFRELQRSNPAPFAAFLELPEGAVVSSSPERFLALDHQGRAESRPIKGTRPRSLDPANDAVLAGDLATAEKDRAENAMIVDLVRNDLGKVCRFGSVETPALFAVETFATVHQLVSTIRGQLAEGRDGIDLVEAAFPPGSMTGAPKIEAVTILEHLEPHERGVYSGALGWLDLGGALDLSVVIRAAVVRDGLATFATGGAIVADSDPELEHEETEHKARALVAALAGLERAAPAPPTAVPLASSPTSERAS